MSAFEIALAGLVARSRAIGARTDLVVHGGGNTSSKTVLQDRDGVGRAVMLVKGSGTDLRTIGPDGFPGVWLDPVLPLRARAEMTDEEMVCHLTGCLVEPDARAPSIETLLHAFLPAQHVDHTHPDAICAISNAPGGRALLREALGPGAAIVPYIRPGFDLARQVADCHDAEAVVLEHHGLVTWGDEPEVSVNRTLDLVARAEAFLRRHLPPPPIAGAPASDAVAIRTLLILRGSLGHRILVLDRGQQALADHHARATIAAVRGTPDQMLRIGRASLALDPGTPIPEQVAAWAAASARRFSRLRHRLPPSAEMHSPLPRVVLAPGLGCVAVGASRHEAQVLAEIAAHSHGVAARTVDAFGAIAWLRDEEILDFEYWPLELRKLADAPAPAPAPLAGRIGVVCAADTEQGAAICRALVAAGAHLAIDGAERAQLAGLRGMLGADRVIVAGDDPVGEAVLVFGGVDLLVLPAGARADELSRTRGDHASVGDRFGKLTAVQGLGATLIRVGPSGGLGDRSAAGRQVTVETSPDLVPAAVADRVVEVAGRREGRSIAPDWTN